MSRPLCIAALCLAAPLFLLGYACLPGSPPPPPETEWFYVVTEGAHGELRKDAFSDFLTIYKSTARPGEWLHLCRAPAGEVVCSLKVPAGPPMLRLRDPAAADGLQAARAYFAPDRPPGSVQLEVPKLGAMIRSARCSDLGPRIVLVGTPIYRSQQHAGFDFSEGVAPTDGCLQSPVTPFGAGVTPLPDGTMVVWRTLGPNWGYDNLHEAAVERFWGLFFQTYNARLVKMTPRVSEIAWPDPHSMPERIEPRDDGVGLVDYRRQSKKRPVASGQPSPIEVEGGQPQAFQVEVVDRLLARAAADPEKIALAIGWVSEDPRSDIDLHVASSGSEKELSFASQQADFGQHFKDVRAPSGAAPGDAAFASWECIRIDHDRAQDLRVWLHSFRSESIARVTFAAVYKGQRKDVLIEMPSSTRDTIRQPRTSANGWRSVNLLSPDLAPMPEGPVAATGG